MGSSNAQLSCQLLSHETVADVATCELFSLQPSRLQMLQGSFEDLDNSCKSSNMSLDSKMGHVAAGIRITPNDQIFDDINSPNLNMTLEIKT